MGSQDFLGTLTNIGLLAICALAVTVATTFRTDFVRVRSAFSLWSGLAFGATTALLITFSTRNELGSVIDARAAPAILSGVFGGPLAAAITTLIGGAARYSAGGPFVIGGTASVGLYAFGGLLLAATYRAVSGRKRIALGFLELVALATLCTVLVLPSFFMDADIATSVAAARKVVPLLVLQNVVAVGILGAALRITLRMIDDRTSLTKLSRKLSVANERLVDTNAKLSDSVSEMEQLLHVVSHDLRSPIVTLRGFVDIMQLAVERDDAPAILRACERVSKSAALMDTVVVAVLDHSRSRKDALQKEPVSVRRELETIVDVIGFRDRFAKPMVEFFGEDAPIEADRGCLIQIVMNLLANARAHSGRDDDLMVRVTTELARDDALGPVTILSLADNGVGIPNEFRSEVFRLFRRLSSSSSGSGIGLATVARSAQLHGGRAWMEDSCLGGVCVKVAFPASTRLTAVA